MCWINVVLCCRFCVKPRVLGYKLLCLNVLICVNFYLYIFVNTEIYMLFIIYSMFSEGFWGTRYCKVLLVLWFCTPKWIVASLWSELYSDVLQRQSERVILYSWVWLARLFGALALFQLHSTTVCFRVCLVFEYDKRLMLDTFFFMYKLMLHSPQLFIELSRN